jgi:hypothetical protein
MSDITSPFGNLFLKIQARLDSEITGLYIDQDLGQLEHYETRPSVPFPCALLDIDDFDFDDMAYNKQKGEGYIKIRLAVAAWSPSSSLVPDEVKLKAMGYYDMEQKVHEALQGWCDDGFSKLLRRKSKTELREDNIRVRIIIYKTSFEDGLINKNTTIARPPFTIA